MADNGEILSTLEEKFGSTVDHEVIKLILQNVNWNAFEAEKQLSTLSEPSDSPLYSAAVAKEVNEITTYKNEKNKSEEIHTNNFNSKCMIIMRGLPGSGKSFEARKLLSCYSKSLNPGIILSTDDYFYDNQGYYHFNPPLISEAHNWNQNRARQSLYRQLSPIIIDNTNLQQWEIEPYVSLALNYGYYIMMVEPDTPWRYEPYLLSRKCIHKVSMQKIKDLKLRFDRSFTIDQMICCIRSKNLPIVHTVHRTDDHDDESEDDPDIVENNSIVQNTNLISQEMTGDHFNDIKLDGNFQQNGTEILNQFMKEDEALARKLQDQENAKHDSAYLSTYSHPLYLQKLTKKFSHVDSEVVKKTYDTTTLRVDDNARAVLCSKYGTEKQPPINMVADQANCIKYSLHPQLMPASATEKNQILEIEANRDYLTVENHQEYRNEAARHYRAGKEDLDKAQKAKGVDPAVAAFYTKSANLHSQKMAEANASAANLILQMMNANKDENTLDLHLLRVDEAIQATQDFLLQRQIYMQNNNIRGLNIKLITGRGRHSAGCLPKVKPAIQFFLQKEKYLFVEVNAGCLKVTLCT